MWKFCWIPGLFKFPNPSRVAPKWSRKNFLDGFHHRFERHLDYALDDRLIRVQIIADDLGAYERAARDRIDSIHVGNEVPDHGLGVDAQPDDSLDQFAFGVDFRRPLGHES